MSKETVRELSVPTADEYRRLAAECVELAPKISPGLRDIFIALAQGWANLAEYLDEDHSTLPDAPPAEEDEVRENSNGAPDGSGEAWVK
jgi:hypothetical protein